MVVTISNAGQAILDAYNSYKKANFAPNISKGRAPGYAGPPRITPTQYAAVPGSFKAFLTDKPVNMSPAPTVSLPLQVTDFPQSTTTGTTSASLFDSIKTGLSDIQRTVGPTGIAITALILGIVLIKKI